jgi:NitT/TauT family transport system permease protein
MKKFWRTLAGIATLLLLWQLAALGLHKSILVPAPSETLQHLFHNFTSPDMLLAAGQTGWKVLLALALAILLGLPFGFLLGLSDAAYSLLRPLIMVIQAVPVISWLSLVIFTWGIGWRGPVFISFLSLFPVAVLTTVAGVHDLDKDLLEMAHLYKVPGNRIIREIYFGSLLPFIAAILDVSIGHAWKVMLVSEYLCGGNGLGEAILMARMNVDIPAVWALTLGAVLLGLLSEALLKSIMRRFQAAWTRS